MKKQRLLLNRETLRKLTDQDAQRVHGAAGSFKTCHSGQTCPLPVTQVGICLGLPPQANTSQGGHSISISAHSISISAHSISISVDYSFSG